MSPQPNEQDNKNILNDEIDTNASELAVNLALASEDEPNGVSDESDNEAETDYAGYKLLQQDDAPNGCMDSSDDDAERQDKTEREGFADFQSMDVSVVDIDINYQNLHCAGVDEFPVTLGFPELPAENGSSDEKEKQDEDMSDSQVELVRRAMAGFSLPAINIPEWAKDLSEDEWQKTLETTVQKKK